MPSSSEKQSASPRITIKQILLGGGAWWQFYQKHKARLREAIVVNITRLLSCRHAVRGFLTYSCSNPHCSHTKKVPFSCHSRMCSSCGKKATEAWIEKQNGILPNTTWQHITFTMPDTLWDFFWHNRSLLNEIAALAAKTVQDIAAKKNVIPGIFVAIHTFGRNLKRNVHIHLSTTLGGITADATEWKSLYFKTSVLMSTWRYELITLLRKRYQEGKLIIPAQLRNQLNTRASVLAFFDQQYRKTWIVHAAKSSEEFTYNVAYLARYTKRPPIAQSKLSHYDGQEVVFKFLDHNTKTGLKFRCTVEEFIGRFIQHIPDIGFRMIRYYGFLANRVRGTLLPKVHALLNSTYETPSQKNSLSWTQLMQREFQLNPLICLLCQSTMQLTGVTLGISSSRQLTVQHHRALALMLKIPV